MKIEVQFSITESATEEIKKFMDESNSFVRISLTSSTCSGSIYSLEMLDESELDPSLTVFEEMEGINFVMDKDSAFSLDGVTLDWRSEGEESGFIFLDTKQKSCCRKKGGCS